MIRNVLRGGQPRPEQTVRRPTVYFDQWLWVDLSRDPMLSERLSHSLKAADASLLYSVVTLLELSSIRKREQLDLVCSVMDSADYGFIPADPREVIERERLGIIDPDSGGIPPDYEFVRLASSPEVGIAPDTPSSPFRRIQEEAPRESLNLLRTDFGTSLESRIDKARKDPAAIDRARGRARQCRLDRERPLTRCIWASVIDFIALNSSMKMPSSEWLDLAHIVVPLAYCDFVLLDSRWQEVISQQKFPESEIARTLTRRSLGDFIAEMEGSRSHGDAVV